MTLAIIILLDLVTALVIALLYVWAIDRADARRARERAARGMPITITQLPRAIAIPTAKRRGFDPLNLDRENRL